MNETTAQPFSWSGAFQTLASGALGYLDKRMDVEQTVRLAEVNRVQQLSRQTPIQQYANGAGPLGMNLGAMLPLLAVGVVVLLLVRR